MARPRYPTSTGPTPPPLPSERRTVGQLVAETLRLYGRNVWFAVALGAPVAVMQQLYLARLDLDRVDGRSVVVREEPWLNLALLVGFAPLFSLAYAAASARVGGVRLTGRTALAAVAVGTLAFLPSAPLFGVFVRNLTQAER